MSVEFQCPQCESSRRVSSAMAGRRIRCPDCDQLVEVPAAPQTPDGRWTEAPAGEAAAADSADSADSAAADSADRPAASGVAEQRAGAADDPAAGGRPSGTAVEDEPGDGSPGSDGGGLDDGGDGEGGELWEEEDDEPAPLREKKPMAEGEMDMTPMVDVTFLLLIFFMVTAAFSLQKSIQIPKPEKTDEPSTKVMEEPEETPDLVTVQIDEYNTFTVLTADWEKEAAGEIDLIARLRESRQGNDAGIVPNELLVKAHGKALHYRVVMALDAGSETGFEDVQLMTVDDEF